MRIEVFTILLSLAVTVVGTLLWSSPRVLGVGAYVLVTMLFSAGAFPVFRSTAVVIVAILCAVSAAVGLTGVIWAVFFMGENEIFTPSFLGPPGCGLAIACIGRLWAGGGGPRNGDDRKVTPLLP